MPETKEATLSDLLGEWAELEPVRCVQQQRAIGGSRKAVWVIDGEMITPLRSNKEAFIQAAVQEAIEEADCRWSRSRGGRIVIYESDGKTEHAAGSFPDPMDESEYSEAYRLLAAWIDALRAHA